MCACMHACMHYFQCGYVEYYYDIDFTDCVSQEIHERNRILYESYCRLVSVYIIQTATLQCIAYTVFILEYQI